MILLLAYLYHFGFIYTTIGITVSSACGITVAVCCRVPQQIHACHVCVFHVCWQMTAASAQEELGKSHAELKPATQREVGS